jgi:uncharacterized protein (TIGR00297 family)
LTRDLLLIGFLGLLVLAAAWWSARLRSAGYNSLLTRKLLHVLAIGSCAVGLLWLDQVTLLLWIALGVYPLLVWLVVKKQFQHEERRPAWGILWFPPAMFLVWFITGSNQITAAAMAVLAISDAAAALVGASLKRLEFSLTGDRKSLPGSAAFFFSAFALLLLFREMNILHISFGVVCLAALCGTLLEAMGTAGRDNLFVPVGVALALTVHDSLMLTTSAWLLLPLCFLLFRRGWLSVSGAVAAWLMAVGIIAFGGIYWLLPPLMFLVLGTLLGKLPGKTAQDVKQGRARDHIQVWCNGGIALLALWLGGEHGQLLFLISMAISCADTCSSELGTRFGRKTVHPLTLKPMMSGTSGGMSLWGTLAAVPAALLIALCAETPEAWLTITLAGFSGMCLDSIFGALFQAKFLHADGLIREHSGPGAKQIQGVFLVNNDVVNVASNAAVTGISALLLLIPFG